MGTAQHVGEERVKAENETLRAAHDKVIRWLADALERNQIVHESDRERARAFVAAARDGDR